MVAKGVLGGLVKVVSQQLVGVAEIGLMIEYSKRRSATIEGEAERCDVMRHVPKDSWRSLLWVVGVNGTKTGRLDRLVDQCQVSKNIYVCQCLDQSMLERLVICLFTNLHV